MKLREILQYNENKRLISLIYKKLLSSLLRIRPTIQQKMGQRICTFRKRFFKNLNRGRTKVRQKKVVLHVGAVQSRSAPETGPSLAS